MTLEKQIQHELERLDFDLFLDKEQHPVYGFIFYSVKKRIEGSKPFTVVEWCVGDTPLPLSMEIVSKVRSQEGDIREAISQAIVHNAARAELLRQEREKRQDEAIEDWQKSKPGKVGVVISEDLPVAKNRDVH